MLARYMHVLSTGVDLRISCFNMQCGNHAWLKYTKHTPCVHAQKFIRFKHTTVFLHRYTVGYESHGSACSAIITLHMQVGKIT